MILTIQPVLLIIKSTIKKLKKEKIKIFQRLKNKKAIYNNQI